MFEEGHQVISRLIHLPPDQSVLSMKISMGQQGDQNLELDLNSLKVEVNTYLFSSIADFLSDSTPNYTGADHTPYDYMRYVESQDWVQPPQQTAQVNVT